MFVSSARMSANCQHFHNFRYRTLGMYTVPNALSMPLISPAAYSEAASDAGVAGVAFPFFAGAFFPFVGAD